MIFKIKKLLSILKVPFFIRALLKGSVAGVEHKSVLDALKSCRHVVDIGANRGQFALISRLCYPDARIDSFEPLDEPSLIYRSVFTNDDRAHLHQSAVGHEVAVATIHVSNRDDSSSLLPISDTQEAMFSGTGEKETRTVHVTPLDDVLSADDIESPALLKIDVQGSELSALRGCETLLVQFSYAYIECSFIELYTGQSFADEIITYLANHRFRVIGVYNMHYDHNGKAVQADFMFERSG
jgi:FkbM family methyltransferase